MLAVGERNRRRSVPRLHETAVVLVKRLFRPVHLLIPKPRFRNEHHRDMGRLPASENEKFKRIVQNRRVAAVRIQNRHDFFQIRAERFGHKLFLARRHPVDVAAQRVDLAVMDQVAVRMGPLPARKRVRAEARVHESKRRTEPFILQIQIKRIDLFRRQKPFIHDRSAREARYIALVVFHTFFELFADHIQLPFKRQLISHVITCRDKHLTDERLALPRQFAKLFTINWNCPPSEQPLPFLSDDLIEHRFIVRPFRFLFRQKEHPDPVAPFFRQVHPAAHRLKILMRNLRHNARAIACFRIAPLSAAVFKLAKHMERFFDNVM
ncbi:hypothetical protein B4109_1240 [Geobacillus stearothermophilus]|uniref:Uncharacterized protein n=1 Tax=Geobacillus stearothermophilus TaxID=1422 RepID=A0A150MRE7_GEOSE|nr:hypothetical protein B4109_1240 [Geobacillus stearothermophilus]